uniref:Polyprotein n=1 Tax=Clytia hemisphaerica TaxID=252671 RepID=A0A7M5V2B3_9CNID
KQHWIGVKRVLRYLKGTLDYGLIYEGSESGDILLHGFADADWAGDIDTRKSTSGYVFKVGNSTVSWKSKRQSIVALSTTEAEYVALSQATQEVIWLRTLFKGMDFEQTDPSKMFEDNQGAIDLAKNPTHHSRTKHIDIKFHHVRDAVAKKVIDLEYCP